MKVARSAPAAFPECRHSYAAGASYKAATPPLGLKAAMRCDPRPRFRAACGCLLAAAMLLQLAEWMARRRACLLEHSARVPLPPPPLGGRLYQRRPAKGRLDLKATSLHSDNCVCVLVPRGASLLVRWKACPLRSAGTRGAAVPNPPRGRSGPASFALVSHRGQGLSCLLLVAEVQAGAGRSRLACSPLRDRRLSRMNILRTLAQALASGRRQLGGAAAA